MTRFHVWLVTSGSYDDYKVHVACTTEAAAEAVAARLNADPAWYSFEGYYVDSVPLDDDFPRSSDRPDQ